MNKKKGLILVVAIIFIPFCFFPLYAAGQGSGDAETPSMIIDLAGSELVWRVDNATGVFADENFQSGDLIKYQVLSADLPTQKYIVSYSKKSWGQSEYEESNGTYVAGGLLVARNWEDVGTEYVAEIAYYWGSEIIVNREYVSTYLLEWWNLNLINTVSIKYEMNDTNYDESIYSRSEGILLTRTASVNANNGTYQGHFSVSLVSYSGFLALSPWYWLVMALIVIGYFVVVIILIASVVRKREMVMEDPDKVNYGGAIIGFIFIAAGAFSMLQALFNPIILHPDFDSIYPISPIGIVFAEWGIGLMLLMITNKDKARKAGTIYAIALIAIAVGLLLLMLPLIMISISFNTLRESYTLLPFILDLSTISWSCIIFALILILLLNTKEERDVGIAIAVFIITIGISFYLLFDRVLYSLTLTSQFNEDILRVWVSILFSQLGIIFFVMSPFIIFLPLLRKR